jgi:hypothetical protein
MNLTSGGSPSRVQFDTDVNRRDASPGRFPIEPMDWLRSNRLAARIDGSSPVAEL